MGNESKTTKYAVVCDGYINGQFYHYEPKIHDKEENANKEADALNKKLWGELGGANYSIKAKVVPFPDEAKFDDYGNIRVKP